MSDSSEDEDLSRFKEAVDTSFVKLIDESRRKTPKCTKIDKPHSERYLEVPTNYNDVRVSKELQKSIGDKVSAIINNLVEYVENEHQNVKKRKIKGGIKLFNDSEDFLSCEEAKDTFTDDHNRISKEIKRKQKKRLIDQCDSKFSDSDKIKAAVVTGSYVATKEEVRHWESRRKEKLYTYKAVGKNKNILIAVQNDNKCPNFIK
ncbi:uncharacterized protein LOC120628103 [Pararge aegeria]|uniref:uncharacterized protein LOC120628103 n=1 Tax=Pararge aegeria TaxID=116150 RepID=UPI0019CFBF88|nr:uncharacterized protein LOC120628103 [Pararge aegeria]